MGSINYEALLSPLSKQCVVDKFQERLESNLGPLGEKQEWYAMRPPSFLYPLVKAVQS